MGRRQTPPRKMTTLARPWGAAGDWQRPLTRGEAAQLLSAAMTLAEKKQESAGLLSGLFK